MKRFFTGLFLTLLCLNVFSQDINWANTFGGRTEYTDAMEIDEADNIFVTGTFFSNQDFDPGPGTFFPPRIGGGSDAYIAKFGADGRLLWAKSWGGTNIAEPTNLALGPNQTFYTTGWIRGTVDVDPGPGTTSFTATGNQDLFLTRYDSSGALLNAIHISNATQIRPFGLAADSDGNTYLGGEFEANTDFDPDTGTFILTHTGFSSGFVASYDSVGGLRWAFKLARTSGSSSVDVQDLALDDSNNVYVVGKFSGTVDFDPSSANSFLSVSGEGEFLAKYDSAGNYIWARVMGGRFENVRMDVDDDYDLYFHGRFFGSIDFDPGSSTNTLTTIGSSNRDGVIGKYDRNGNYIWAKHLKDGGNSFFYPIGIRFGASDEFYITGEYFGSTDFDPGSANQTLTSTGSQDIYLAAYDDDGDYNWAITIGTLLGSNQNDYPFGMVAHETNGLYFMGYRADGIDFDPGPDSMFLPNSGGFMLNFCYTLEYDISSSSNFNVCEGDSVEMAILFEDYGYDSLRWQVDMGSGFVDLNDGLNYSGTTDTILKINPITASMSGNEYRCRVYSSCGSESQSEEYNLTVTPEPLANFSYTTVNNETRFTNLSSSSNSRVWDFGDGSPISLQNNPRHEYDSSGTYLVRLQANGLCGVSDTTKEVVVELDFTGISSLEENKANVYPVITSGILQLENFPARSELSVFNLLGKEVLSFDNPGKTVDIGQLNQGWYILRLTSQENDVDRTWKVMKQ